MSPYKAALRNVIRNSSILAIERVVFGFVGLLAYTIAVRVLTLEEFGIVLLLQTYVRFVAGLTMVQSWKAVLTFGQKIIDQGDNERFRRLTGFLIRLDTCAVLVALAVAFLLMGPMARFLGWPADVVAIAPYYTLILIVTVPSTPIGLLRLYDKVTAIAARHAINSTIRLIGAVWVYLADGGIVDLAIVWGLAAGLSALFVYVEALRQCWIKDLWPRLFGGFETASLGIANLWRFIGVTNLSAFLENAVGHVSVLFIGGAIGATEVALYSIARQITGTLSKASSILSPVIFPEISRLEARGERSSLIKLLSRMIFYSAIFLSSVVVVLAVFGPHILQIVFGDKAVAAQNFMVISGLATCVAALGFSFEPVLLSFQKENKLLHTLIISLLIYGVALTILMKPLGLIGVGIALLARSVYVTMARGVFVYKVVNR